MKPMKEKTETKLSKQPWETKFNIDDIAGYEKDDINFDYKGVIFTYRHLPNNVQMHEQAGYSVCYKTGSPWSDDRDFAPDNSNTVHQNRNPDPCIKVTKDGHSMVLMRIPKEQARKLAEQQLKDYQERAGKQLALGAGSKQTVSYKNGQRHVHIKDQEMNFSPNQPNQEDNN